MKVVRKGVVMEVILKYKCDCGFEGEHKFNGNDKEVNEVWDYNSKIYVSCYETLDIECSNCGKIFSFR